MIKVSNLVRTFHGIPAVNDISFEVDAGENLVLLGTSGCGKTTTLRMINRLEKPDSGQVQINGLDIKTEQPEQLRRGIGYVLQNHGLFPHYTVAENVAIVPKLMGWEQKRTTNRAAVLFEKLNLEQALINKYPEALSGGQQQRVGLARALMVNPAILLMDEPFGALDNVTRAGIRKEFIQLDELKQTTIVMVTHDVQEAFEIGDRICLMDKGKIMQIGRPEELLFNPANKFVFTFLNDQRLQLELKTVRMSALFPHGIPEGLLNGTPYLSNSEDVSVWALMEDLLKEESPNNKRGNGQLDVLMHAFENFKRR
jgi:osmoprotectant transport system ATP-binding protein